MLSFTFEIFNEISSPIGSLPTVPGIFGISLTLLLSCSST